MADANIADLALELSTIDALRRALAGAGYSVEGVTTLLGPMATAALARNETTPGLRATSDFSTLSTLVRLWQPGS